MLREILAHMSLLFLPLGHGQYAWIWGAVDANLHFYLKIHDSIQLRTPLRRWHTEIVRISIFSTLELRIFKKHVCEATTKRSEPGAGLRVDVICIRPQEQLHYQWSCACALSYTCATGVVGCGVGWNRTRKITKNHLKFVRGRRNHEIYAVPHFFGLSGARIRVYGTIWGRAQVKKPTGVGSVWEFCRAAFRRM